MSRQLKFFTISDEGILPHTSTTQRPFYQNIFLPEPLGTYLEYVDVTFHMQFWPTAVSTDSIGAQVGIVRYASNFDVSDWAADLSNDFLAICNPTKFSEVFHEWIYSEAYTAPRKATVINLKIPLGFITRANVLANDYALLISPGILFDMNVAWNLTITYYNTQP